MSKKSKQINISVSGESRRMIEWMKKYDSDFNSEAKVAAYLIQLGVEKLKEMTAPNRTDLDEDVYESIQSYNSNKEIESSTGNIKISAKAR